jgi:hypothetical protein
MKTAQEKFEYMRQALSELAVPAAANSLHGVERAIITAFTECGPIVFRVHAWDSCEYCCGQFVIFGPEGPEKPKVGEFSLRNIADLTGRIEIHTRNEFLPQKRNAAAWQRNWNSQKQTGVLR